MNLQKERCTDSFDWESMKSGSNDFQSKILKLKKQIRKANPDFYFIALGAGTCGICDTCTYEQQLPCRKPNDAPVKRVADKFFLSPTNHNLAHAFGRYTPGALGLNMASLPPPGFHCTGYNN
jgi:hypothetical protein